MKIGVVANGSSRNRAGMCQHPEGISREMKKSGTAETIVCQRFRLFEATKRRGRFFVAVIAQPNEI